MDFKVFTKNYFDKLKSLLDDIDLNELEKIYFYLSKTSGKIYIIGNGGSSATASHMVNDFSIGLKHRNVKNFNAISLSENSAVNFAIANDIGFENTFYIQLRDVLKPDDCIIAISCSGNSPNIIKACEYGKNIGATIISFTGFDGGKLKNLSNINVHVNSKKGEYGITEDIHMIFNHVLYSFFLKVYNEL